MNWTVVGRMLVGAWLVLGGCAGTTEPSDPDDAVIGTVSNPLASGAVLWINGTYTSCTSRTGSWSARVSGTATMDNPALTVVTNDTSCKLAITSVMADQSYAASPAIVLGTAYAASPATFGTGSTSFIGNANLNSASFASDFTISFVYGDSSSTSLSSSNVSGGYATTASSVSVTLVPAANDTMDISNLRFTADPVQLIVGLTGAAVLTMGTLPGDTYVIDPGTLATLPTYLQVGNTYNSYVSTQKTISGSTMSISASDFGVLTLSILGSTQVRNVIVKRTVGGVAAYQIFKVTFIS